MVINMGYNKKNIISYLIVVILFIAVIFLSIFASSKIEIESDKELYISEIMPINKNTLKDMDNEYSDYIEIYNSHDYEINLKDYYLSDDSTSSKKWTFPEITIKGNEYLIVFASGKDKCDFSVCWNLLIDLRRKEYETQQKAGRPQRRYPPQKRGFHAFYHADHLPQPVR